MSIALTHAIRRVAILVLAATALLAAGCGSDEGESATSAAETSAPAPTAEQGSKAEGSRGDEELPKALAANSAQANQILEEGSLDAKLADLEGFPVVVNQWASWCPPCRAELPFFSQSAEEHAGEIAFVGIDMEDDRGAAEQFLAEVPLPFPSVDDPSREATRELGGGVVSPSTFFIDEKGEVVQVFQGAYSSQEQLEQDIERHLTN